LNGAKNTIQNSGVGPNLSWSFAKDGLIDIRASARLNFSKAAYGLQPQLNSNYLQQVYGLESTQNLPLGLIFNNTFNYTINTGRADGYNIDMPIWNASLAKGFLKIAGQKLSSLFLTYSIKTKVSLDLPAKTILKIPATMCYSATSY